MFMFTTPDFLGASRKKRRNNRTGTRLRLSRSHQPGLSGNKTRGTWPLVLFAGAAEFLQLNDGSFVVVNTCANNVRRVAHRQRIANFTRALFFAWFWPPILDPHAGGSFCCFTEFGENSVPLVPFRWWHLPRPRAFDRMLCLPTCSFKLVCRPLALPALGVPPNVTIKPKQIMRPNSYNASQGNTTAPMCWSAWFVV